VTTSDVESSNAIELAAEIVAAFVANNSLPIVELPALIHSVHAALARLASGPVNTAPLVEKQEPAVRLSDGRAQLRGGAIGNGQADRTWADAEECRAGQEGHGRRAE